MLIAHPSLSKRYRQIAEVSRSDRAGIFRIEDRDSGRDLALKVLHVPESRHQERLEWFHLRTEQLREARDPSLPEILDFGQLDDGQLFLISEWVSATPLGRFGRQSPAIALFYAIQLADCLSRLALHNSVLLNLSQENVVVQEDGRIRVLGLGTPYCNPEAVRRRRNGRLNPCAAPETGHLAALKSHQLWRADLFSFGALTATELGCSVRGAAGLTPRVTLPPLLSGLRAAPLVQDVLQECLNAEPERRPPDYSVLVQLLERTLATLAPQFDPKDDQLSEQTPHSRPITTSTPDQEGSESLNALREMWEDGLSDVDLHTVPPGRPRTTAAPVPQAPPPGPRISDTQPLDLVTPTEAVLQADDAIEIAAEPNPAAIHQLLRDPIFQHQSPRPVESTVRFEEPPELPGIWTPSASPATPPDRSSDGPRIHYLDEMGSPSVASGAHTEVVREPSDEAGERQRSRPFTITLDWRHATAAAGLFVLFLFLRWLAGLAGWFDAAEVDPSSDPPQLDDLRSADAQARLEGGGPAGSTRLPASVARDLGLDPLDTNEPPPEGTVAASRQLVAGPASEPPPSPERPESSPRPNTEPIGPPESQASDSEALSPAAPPAAQPAAPPETAAEPSGPDPAKADQEAEVEPTPEPSEPPPITSTESRPARDRAVLQRLAGRALTSGRLTTAKDFRDSLSAAERRLLSSSSAGRRQLSFLDLAVGSADEVEADLEASRPISATERATQLSAAFPQFPEVTALATRSLEAARDHIAVHLEEGDAAQALADLDRIGGGANPVLRGQRVAAEALLRRQDARNRLTAIEDLIEREQPHRALELLSDVQSQNSDRAQDLERVATEQLARLDGATPTLEVDPFRPHLWQANEQAMIHLLASDDYGVVGVRFVLITQDQSSAVARELPVEDQGDGAYRVVIPASLHQGRPVQFWAEVWDRSRHLTVLGDADEPIVLNGLGDR